MNTRATNIFTMSLFRQLSLKGYVSRMVALVTAAILCAITIALCFESVAMTTRVFTYNQPVKALCSCNQSRNHTSQISSSNVIKQETRCPEHSSRTFKGMYHDEDVQLYLYSSFIDDRVSPNVLRIFGVVQKTINFTKLECKFITTTGNIEATWKSGARWSYIDNSWPGWSPYFAVHIECVVDKLNLKPTFVEVFVSVHEHMSVRLPIERAIVPHMKKPLAVVVKPVTGQFQVSRLVEWFEIQRLAGISDFILYNTDLSGPGRYVLDYYKNLGLVHTVSFPYLYSVLLQVEQQSSISSEDRYAVYQQVYLVALQDALYRFYKSYKYLIIIDLDEVILPTRHESLLASVERLVANHQNGAGFTFNTAWHFEDAGPLNDTTISPYLYMQKYAKSSVPIDNQPKSIITTSRSRTINFHAVVTSLEARYQTEVMVDWTQYGYVHHYRGACKDKFQSHVCHDVMANTAVNDVITRYRPNITDRVVNVLDYLQLK